MPTTYLNGTHWTIPAGWISNSGTGIFTVRGILRTAVLTRDIQAFAVGYSLSLTGTATLRDDYISWRYTDESGNTRYENINDHRAFTLTIYEATDDAANSLAAWLNEYGTARCLTKHYVLGNVGSSGAKVFRELNTEDYAYRYVSLGDSIAAGQRIREEADLLAPKCLEWQYGTAGVRSTRIISGSYTDQIRTYLGTQYGHTKVRCKSFARSGDTVRQLIDKLNHPTLGAPMKEEIRKANLVTVCIGANDVLQPVMERFNDYVANGQSVLDELEATVNTGLATLQGTGSYSYRQLFTILHDLNPNAQIIFTNIYNPYKYFYAEPSTASSNYKDGLLGPLMWAIPDSISTAVANEIRSAFMNTAVVKTMFERVNKVSSWAETQIRKLNQTLTDSVAAFNQSNIKVADTKSVFETIPDRPYDGTSGVVHYNDLVNVDVTRGYTIEDLNWGEFWSGVNYATIINGIDAFAANVMDTILNDVIIPDADPHPEQDGQTALYRSFMDAAGFVPITRYTVTYAANNGSGQTAQQVLPHIFNNYALTFCMANPYTYPVEGYYFTEWTASDSTKPVAGNPVYVSSNLTITAQWSNLYAVNFYKRLNSYAATVYAGNNAGNTGIQECYGVQISTDGGATFQNLDTAYYRGYFASSGTSNKYINSISLPYGTYIRVWVTCTRGDSQTVFGYTRYQYENTTSHAYLNGSLHVGGTGVPTYCTFRHTSNADIIFEWVLSGTVYVDATANWNAYITT